MPREALTLVITHLLLEEVSLHTQKHPRYCSHYVDKTNSPSMSYRRRVGENRDKHDYTQDESTNEVLSPNNYARKTLLQQQIRFNIMARIHLCRSSELGEEIWQQDSPVTGNIGFGGGTLSFGQIYNFKSPTRWRNPILWEHSRHHMEYVRCIHWKMDTRY